MVEQSLKLSLDLVYPPPCHYPNTAKHYAPLVNLETFKYQLIFDSSSLKEDPTKKHQKTDKTISNCLDIQWLKLAILKKTRFSWIMVRRSNFKIFLELLFYYIYLNTISRIVWSVGPLYLNILSDNGLLVLITSGTEQHSHFLVII